MEILRIENLTFSYPLTSGPVLKDVSLKIEKGEFSVLCGSTGCGKSTLLKLIKKQIAPLGEKKGCICFDGKDTDTLSDEVSSSKIGFVMQNPELQIVTDKVWHELSFGLENMGLPQNEIARRVAEMSYYFGIDDWYDKKTSELSGGQKQLLNLASVMVMNPDLLILDEPTSQLDPIAASEFITTLKKLNADMSLTILVAEHRLEELIPVCDRLIVLKDGKIEKNGSPREIASAVSTEDSVFPFLPAPVRFFSLTQGQGECPVSVREGRAYLEKHFKNEIHTVESAGNSSMTHPPVIEFKDVCFRYTKNQKDVLNYLNFNIYENEILCLLGGNGSGKTTFLNILAGILKPYYGNIRLFGKKIGDYKNQSLYRNCITLLPQDVQTVFLKNTVGEEMKETGFSSDEFPFDISYLYSRHPYDISGGEQQLVALAKALATHPKILLMDEPTKGIDAQKKGEFNRILHRLKAQGVTVIIVTHDVEFAASCADRCALFFRGNIVSEGSPDQFFSGNHFYTTAVSHMTKGFYKNTVLVDDLVKLCQINGEKR